MRAIRLLDLFLISFFYWTAAAILLFVIVLPCGMGPEADCDMASDFTIWSAVTGIVLVYTVICLLLVRRWSAK